MTRPRCSAIGVIAIVATVSVSASSAAAQVAVPFVGCPSEGQAGPFDPPKGKPKTVALPAALAEHIAYYIGEQSRGVFAPRGWHCQVVYGSSGSTLVVTPAKADPSQFYQSAVSGDAVELEGVSGAASGRFEVAAYGSLLFPKAAAAYVQHIKDDEPEVLKDEQEGLAHLHDSITPAAGRVAKFTTPANETGLGTACSLAPAGAVIHGIAVYREGYVQILRVRLGRDLEEIEAAIQRLNQECMLSASGC